MTGARPADVTIRVRRAESYTHLEFSARQPGVSPLRVTLGNDRIGAAREQLDRGLTGLKDALPASPALPGDPRELAGLYDIMSRLSRRLQFALFGTNAHVVQGLRDFWAAAIPFARNPGLPAPLIECVADIASQLPVECLPLVPLDPQTSIAGPGDLARACRSLIGFSCIIRRIILPVPVRGSLSLATTADGRLPLRYLYFDSLEGAKEELAWLTGVAAHRVHLDGPYPCASVAPGEPAGTARVPSLAEQVHDPGISLAGGRRPIADQVQHFACHCYTGNGDPFDNEVELRGDGTEIRVTLGDLGADLYGLAERSATRPGDLPLVFLNACGSARLRATTAFSFPQLFLEHGNRGCIGTEVEMPDGVAAAFYDKFLLRGRPLGESVLAARTSLIHEHGNPLGLAYTAYADPDIRICPATAESARGDH